MVVKVYKMNKGTVVHIHGIPFELVEDTMMSTEEDNIPLAQEYNEDCQYCKSPRESNHDMYCEYSHGERP